MHMHIGTILTEQSIDDVIETESLDLGLYRGLSRVLDGPTRLPIRSDRRPRDSSLYETVVFNIVFELMYNVADVRNRCAFAAADIETAFMYAESSGTGSGGSVVEARPIKQSKLAWKPGVDDSVTTLNSISQRYHSIKHDRGIEFLDSISNAVELDGVINGKQAVEVAFSNMQDLTTENQKELLDAVKDVMQDIVGGYVIAAANSQPKIPNGVEVMIFDASHYWAIPVDEGFDPYD